MKPRRRDRDSGLGNRMMQRSHTNLRLLATVALCAALLTSSACGGSTNDPATTATAAVFTPFADPPAAGSITMQAGTAAGLAFQIRVTVTGVQHVFGAAFHVTFNSAVVRFDSADFSNSVLKGSGISTQFSATPVLGHANEIAVVATRLQNGAGTVPGVDITQGDLVVLNFHAINGTSGTAISFGTPREACDPTARTCGPVTPVPTWIGGTLSAN